MTRAIGYSVLLAASIAAASCSSGGSTRATTQPSETPSSASQASVDPLVGTWERVNDCDVFVRTLKEAGLIDLAPEWLVGAGYFAKANQVDPADLCEGATEVKHSHFFTELDEFGSYDETGEQVDDGDYTVVDDHTLTFPSHEQEFGSDVTVHYRVEGDTLTFEVVVPRPCTERCVGVTGWAISAFYPTPFHRVG